MDDRSGVGPMEFEWQQPRQLDMTSPFAQLRQSGEDSIFGRKRSHDALESPSKPELQSLREPNSQPFLFSQTPKRPPPQFRAASFNTPQNGRFEMDFSSGAENPSSPEQADTEDTPEPRTSVLFQSTAPEKKHHPMYGRFGASPGRGEIPRGSYSDIVARRVQKRRRKDDSAHRRLMRRMSVDSDSRPSSSEDNKPPPRPPGQPPNEPGFWAWLFALIEAHPRIPHILSWYAQLLFNLGLVLASMRILYNFWSAIVTDVDRASEAESADILAEINQCARDFAENRCGLPDSVPAMAQICENWSRCMNVDPKSIKRSKVTASMFAEILNGFVEPISFKTMIFFCVIFTFCFVASNWTFNTFRQKTSEFQQYQHYGPVHPPPARMIPDYMHDPGYTSGWQPPHGASLQSRHGVDYALPHTYSRMDYGRPRSRSRKRRERSGSASPTKRLEY